MAHACPDRWLTPHRTSGSAASEYSKNIHILAAADYTLLFLGASLNSDKTVEIINQNAGALGMDAGEYFIPIFPTKKEEAECKLENMKPISIGGDYSDIPIVLHQLIRETHTDNEDSFSWQQDLSLQDRGIDCNLKERIVKFLDENTAFKSEKFDNKQRDDILSFLYHHYLYENTEKRGPEWTLCRIYDSRFQFNEEHKNGPLHNYPLGNTIYMFDDSKKDSSGKLQLYSEYVEKISNEIEQWIKDEYPNYNDDEKFSVLDESKTALLKVRIITFEFPPSDREDACKSKKRVAELETVLFKTYEAGMLLIHKIEQFIQSEKAQNEIDAGRSIISCGDFQEDLNSVC